MWATPRFDVPSLALRNASVGEIVLAAQRTITGSTPDVVEFDLAVQAGMRGDREQAEQHWRACLACDEMTAHYGLGYTLIELGRPREAFGHLAMYTEICPRNAWAWAFRGRAAHRMGETAEARLAYQAALGYEAAGSTETNAAIWLAELDAETADNTGATVTTILPQPPATVTARFTEALEYARAHHADQRRKGTTIPYLAHLLAVSAIVLEHGGSETAAIAALLHDVVEDGGGERALAEIGERFGPEVAAIVAGCSDTTAKHKEDWTLAQARATSRISRWPSRTSCSSPAPTSSTTRARSSRTCASTATRSGSGSTAARASSSGTTERCATPSCVGCPAGWPTSWTAPCARSNAASTRRTASPGSGCPASSGRSSGGESGAFIDWPGCPLVVENTEAGPQVRAHVGSGGWFDEETDLEAEIDVELDGLRLEYREPHERAWLISDDHGNLRDACRRVAALAPLVTEQLREAGDLDPPVTSYEERVEQGPWR